MNKRALILAAGFLAALAACGPPSREQQPVSTDASGEAKQLEAQLANDVPAFLAHCQQILDSQPATRLAGVALVKRAQHYADGGQQKLAALDYARLWAVHPDIVEQLALSATIPTSLEQAAFYLESDLLSAANDPAKAAAVVWTHLDTKTAGDVVVNPSSAKSPLELYVVHTPQLDLMRLAGPGPADFTARIACVACRQKDAAAAIELVTAYRDQITAILGDTVATPDLPWLDLCTSAVIKSVKKLRETLIFASAAKPVDEANRETGSLTGAVYGLEELRVSLLNAQATCALAGSPEAFVRATDELAKYCLTVDNRQAVRDAYERVIASLPASPYEAEYRLKLADMYREVWETPSKAIEEYRALRDHCPGTPAALTGQLHECMALRDLKKFREAFCLTQDVACTNPGSDAAPSARLLAAACAVDMDAPELAEAAIWSLVHASPTRPEASQGLLWLANVKVKRQQYAGALDILQYLAKTYPDSEEAAKGRTLIAKLEKAAPAAERK